MFKYMKIFLKIFIILNFLNTLAMIENWEKFEPDFRLHVAIDLLIDTENSGPVEKADIKEWLKKNLESLKGHINFKFADLTPLKRYFRKYSPIDLLEFECWKDLIKNGADPNTIIKSGNPFKNEEYKGSLLHYCAIKNNLKAAIFLKENNINVNLQDSSGRTALHVAILNESQDMINFLIINCKAQLDIKDLDNKTPIYLAVEKDNIKTIELLKTYEADLSIKGFRKQTPLKLAIKNKNFEAIKILNPVLYEKITKKKSRSCDII